MEKTKIASLVASLIMGSQCDTVYVFMAKPVDQEQEDSLIFNTSNATPSSILLTNSEVIKRKILEYSTFSLKIEFYIEGVREPVVSVISFENGNMLEVVESEFDVSFHV